MISTALQICMLSSSLARLACQNRDPTYYGYSEEEVPPKSRVKLANRYVRLSDTHAGTFEGEGEKGLFRKLDVACRIILISL